MRRMAIIRPAIRISFGAAASSSALAEAKLLKISAGVWVGLKSLGYTIAPVVLSFASFCFRTSTCSLLSSLKFASLDAMVLPHSSATHTRALICAGLNFAEGRQTDNNRRCQKITG